MAHLQVLRVSVKLDAWTVISLMKTDIFDSRLLHAPGKKSVLLSAIHIPANLGRTHSESLEPRVVVIELTSGTFGDARRVWKTQGGHTRASLHKEGVCMAVIAPHKLDQLLPLSVCSHKSAATQTSWGPASIELYRVKAEKSYSDKIIDSCLGGVECLLGN